MGNFKIWVAEEISAVQTNKKAMKKWLNTVHAFSIIKKTESEKKYCLRIGGADEKFKPAAALMQALGCKQCAIHIKA
jgi:hypothetical protein